MRALALAPLLLVAHACGWSAGLTAPAGASSVGVELFDPAPAVLELGLEPLFHAELTRSVSDLVDTPLASPDRASHVVRGRITEYRRRSGIRNPENQLLETGVRIAVEASLIERETGRIVVDSVRASVWSGFVVGGPEDEAEARDRALRHLADQLVLDLFAAAVEPNSEPGGA